MTTQSSPEEMQKVILQSKCKRINEICNGIYHCVPKHETIQKKVLREDNFSLVIEAFTPSKVHRFFSFHKVHKKE